MYDRPPIPEISEKNLSALCVSSEAGESKKKTISRRERRVTEQFNFISRRERRVTEIFFFPFLLRGKEKKNS